MKIQDLQKKYKLSKNDFWELKRGQRSVWIITHDACEKIQVVENIKTTKIEILNSEWNFCRFLITMAKEEKEETTIGEALLNTNEEIKKDRKGNSVYKGNCESQYIGAMAEKRGKDRCILKLINAYEYGIYSDTESDDFRKQSISQRPVSNLNPKQVYPKSSKLTFEQKHNLAKEGEIMCYDCSNDIQGKEYSKGQRAGQPYLWCDKCRKTKEEDRCVLKSEQKEDLQNVKKELNF